MAGACRGECGYMGRRLVMAFQGKAVPFGLEFLRNVIYGKYDCRRFQENLASLLLRNFYK